MGGLRNTFLAIFFWEFLRGAGFYARFWAGKIRKIWGKKILGLGVN